MYWYDDRVHYGVGWGGVGFLSRGPALNIGQGGNFESDPRRTTCGASPRSFPTWTLFLPTWYNRNPYGEPAGNQGGAP